jgi:DNA-binding response OmpR family regulator
MLPGMDGLDVCREIRRQLDVPIIMLTARVEEADRLIGLELGADDYVTKPFSPRELVARARAVLRRVPATATSTSTYRFGNVVFDVTAQQCVVDGEVVPLTSTQFSLLQVFVTHPGQVFTPMQLLEAAHLGVYDGVERTIDVHLHNLRRKLEADPSQPPARRLNAGQFSHGPGRVGDEFQGQDTGHNAEAAGTKGQAFERGADQRQRQALLLPGLGLGQGQHRCRGIHCCHPRSTPGQV